MSAKKEEKEKREKKEKRKREGKEEEREEKRGTLVYIVTASINVWIINLLESLHTAFTFLFGLVVLVFCSTYLLCSLIVCSKELPCSM